MLSVLQLAVQVTLFKMFKQNCMLLYLKKKLQRTNYKSSVTSKIDHVFLPFVIVAINEPSYPFMNSDTFV